MNIVALVRNGFSSNALHPLLADITQIHYNIGEPFQPVWEKALEKNPGLVLLIDCLVSLPANLFFLQLQLMNANATVDGVTLQADALETVYGLTSTKSGKYSARQVGVLPSWLTLLKTSSWKNTDVQTPEFFLLSQSAGKKLVVLNTTNIQFDAFSWAGNLIAGSANKLALDYARYNSEAVPPQFRVTIPGLKHLQRRDTIADSATTFSIICPSIRPEFLPEAIESVINQEYPHWELWVGIDGPKPTILRKIQQVVEPYLHDRRIHIEYCDHMGTGPMRRFLSQKGNSNYIVGLDDDDRLRPNILKRFAETIAAHPEVVVLRGGIKLFGLIDAYLPARTRYKINGISNDLFEANQPYAVKRSALESLGGLEWDPQLRNSGEDSDLLLKVDREDMPLIILDEPLYERRLSTYNQTLDCSAESCFQHIHNLYHKHNPRPWKLSDVNLAGAGIHIRMFTQHKTEEGAAQVVCATEFMNFQQVGSREGVVLDLEITSLCNAVCLFCPREKLERTNRFMPIDVVKKVAASLKLAKATPTVVLCGIGESTLHPHLHEVISTLSEAGANVCMTTNGWALSVEYVDKLVAAGLCELNVSLNAASAETHREIMGLKHFDNIASHCEQIALHRAARWPSLKFHVSFVLTQVNVHEVDEFVERWKTKDVSRIWLHPLTNRAGLLSEKCKPVDITQFSHDYDHIPKVLVDLFPGDDDIDNLCHVARQVDFISVEGNMLLCAQDYKAQHKFGNIEHYDLDSLHQSKLLAHLRGETAETCSKCSFCPRSFKSSGGRNYSIVQAKDYQDGMALVTG